MENEYSLKKVAFFLLFGLILIGIPLAAYLVAREQKTDKSEVGQVAEETVVAIINGQEITKADIRKVAEEQYAPNAVNDQALKDALDTLSERMILDEESKRLQISADPQEISEKIEAESFTQTQARYEVLKEKVTLKEVKNWQVFVIGFWVPPNDQREDLTEEELADIKKILSDGLLVLNEAGKLMSSDQEVVEIARSLISKYPKLEKVLGVNGYLLAQAQDSGDLTNLTSPKVYTYQSSNIGQPLFDTIYSMKTPGEVKKALSENDSGGNVIKLVGGNTNVRFNTYEDWLKDKKNEMVEIVIPL